MDGLINEKAASHVHRVWQNVLFSTLNNILPPPIIEGLINEKAASHFHPRWECIPFSKTYKSLLAFVKLLKIECHIIFCVTLNGESAKTSGGLVI